MNPSLSQLLAATDKCIGCGACTVVCPLFSLNRREELGPRGKIRMIRAACELSVPGPRALAHYGRMCLLCGRCVQACPNAVAPAEVIRGLRAVLAGDGHIHPLAAAVARTLAERPRTKAVMAVGRLLLPATSGLVLRLWGGRPPVPAPRPFLADAPSRVPGTRGRVVLFVGCGANFLWPGLARAALMLLARRWEVVVPPGQGCCGLAAASAGLGDLARALARAGTRLVMAAEPELVVSPCASCAYAMSELWPALYPPARDLAPRVREICQLLPELQPGPAGPIPPFALHQPCHHPGDEPLESLLAGAGLKPEAVSRSCCGAGGLLGLSNPGLSRQVLRANPLATCAYPLLLSTCTGCRLQWQSATNVSVVHPVELFAQVHDS